MLWDWSFANWLMCVISHIIMCVPYSLSLQECSDDVIRSEASQLLAQILPVMLCFMADEYDDTCSTVFPTLQTILSSVRTAAINLDHLLTAL